MSGSIDGGNVGEALQYWEIITAFVLPLVLSFLIQSGWKRSTQAFFAFAVSAAVVVGQLYLRGDLDADKDLVASVLKVFALTTAFYHGFWSPSTVTDNIETRSNISNVKAAIAGPENP